MTKISRLAGPELAKIGPLNSPKVTKIGRLGGPKLAKISGLGGPKLTKIGRLGGPKLGSFPLLDCSFDNDNILTMWRHNPATFFYPAINEEILFCQPCIHPIYNFLHFARDPRNPTEEEVLASYSNSHTMNGDGTPFLRQDIEHLRRVMWSLLYLRRSM